MKTFLQFLFAIILGIITVAIIISVVAVIIGGVMQPACPAGEICFENQ